MPLSVGVKGHHDPRLLRCLDALAPETRGAERELLVAVAIGDPLLPCLRRRDVRLVVVPSNDIGARCNHIVAKAMYDQVLLVDDDCIVESGTLDHVEHRLTSASLVRTRVVFESGGSPVSGAIARVRDHIYNEPPRPAYMPGLAFDRAVVCAALGEAPFPEGLPAAVDWGFAHDVRTAGITLATDPAGSLRHGPVTLRHHLRSAWRTGRGTAQLVERGHRPNRERFRWVLSRTVQLRWISWCWRSVRRVGVIGTVMELAWLGAYRAGYHTLRLPLQGSRER